MFTALLFWPSERQEQTVSSVGEKAREKLNLVIKPHIKSVNKKGAPYEIKAESAQRQDTNDTTLMTMPTGQMQLSSGAEVNITSETGTLSSDAKTMALEGQVIVQTDDGYQLKTRYANLNVEDKTAETDAPVKGQSPQGTVQAQGIKIDDQGTVLFKGKTHMVFSVKEE